MYKFSYIKTSPPRIFFSRIFSDYPTTFPKIYLIYFHFICSPCTLWAITSINIIKTHHGTNKKTFFYQVSTFSSLLRRSHDLFISFFNTKLDLNHEKKSEFRQCILRQKKSVFFTCVWVHQVIKKRNCKLAWKDETRWCYKPICAMKNYAQICKKTLIWIFFFYFHFQKISHIFSIEMKNFSKFCKETFLSLVFWLLFAQISKCNRCIFIIIFIVIIE